MALLVLAMVIGCAVPPSTRDIRLTGPEGESTVKLVDEVGIVTGVEGTFRDERSDWVEGVTVLNPLLVEVTWAASCDDATTITILPADRDEIGITVGEPRSRETQCRPRGFVRHTLILQLTKPVQADTIDIEFEGR
jgi:hypothetical protein